MSGKNDEAALHFMYVYTRMCVCVYVSAAPHTTCTVLFTMRRNGTVYVAVNCRGTSHGLTRNTVEVLDDHYRTSARGLPTWTHFNSVHEHRASIMRFMSIGPVEVFSSFFLFLPLFLSSLLSRSSFALVRWPFSTFWLRFCAMLARRRSPIMATQRRRNRRGNGQIIWCFSEPEGGPKVFGAAYLRNQRRCEVCDDDRLFRGLLKILAVAFIGGFVVKVMVQPKREGK